MIDAVVAVDNARLACSHSFLSFIKACGDCGGVMSNITIIQVDTMQRAQIPDLFTDFSRSRRKKNLFQLSFEQIYNDKERKPEFAEIQNRIKKQKKEKQKLEIANDEF